MSAAPFHSLNLGRTTPDDPDRVRDNEVRAIAALGVPDRVARIHLEHGSKILRTHRPGVAGTGDALVTSDRNLVLSLTVADCYPVALIEGSTRALVHCGWRCVVANILEDLFAVDSAFTRAGDTHVWIGPGIGASCYPVGPEVAALFPTACDRTPHGIYLDLEREIRFRLESIGIPKSQIESAGLCTSCHAERFFSHRRDGFPSGRMAAFFA